MSDQKPTPEAVAEILDLAQRAVFSSGARPHEAEEVAQETALKLIDRWNDPKIVKARGRPGKGWGNYVVRVARNVHRDLVRKHNRLIARQRRAAVGSSGAPLNDRPLVHRVQPRDPSGIEEHMARKIVVEAIDSLKSRKQREVMRRIYIDSHTIREIAVELSVDPQTVRLHHRRAKEILRDEFFVDSDD